MSGESFNEANPIKLRIGICSELREKPMTFTLYPDHVEFEDPYTQTDLTICKAVLLDLADAFDKKLLEAAH